jgi:hypothetical protein
VGIFCVLRSVFFVLLKKYFVCEEQKTREKKVAIAFYAPTLAG